MCSEFSGNKSVRRERTGTQKQSSPEKRTNFMQKRTNKAKKFVSGSDLSATEQKSRAAN